MTPPQIHPSAVCSERALGAGVQVAAFAHVAVGAVVGEGCLLGAHASVADGVVLGAHVEVGDGAVVAGGPGVVTSVGPDVRIGANATIHPGAAIGRGAVIEPGAVVAGAIPANAIVRGNPAEIVGYVSADPSITTAIEPAAGSDRTTTRTRVRGVERRPVQRVDDLRGTLTAIEHSILPFQPERIFTVFDVPSERVRGAHAHRACWQFLVCLTGSVHCLVDDGRERDDIELAGADFGLLVPPMVWGTQYRYTADAVLLVLASHAYDADDYIRDYDEFLVEAREA